MAAPGQKPPRYRLGLAEPLFQIAMPLVDFRGLTERELDELVGYLRGVEVHLREYDAEAAALITAADALPNPWWAELRQALLARGEDQQWLDSEFSACYGTEGYSFSKEPWFAPLLGDIVRRCDPAPLGARLSTLIEGIGALDVGKLTTAIACVAVFHPFGMPHQLQIENIGELFGMRPIAKTEGSGVVYGYGEEEAPKKMPWQTGEVKGRIGEVPTKDPEEPMWIPVYEGLLSWIGEVVVILQDRTSDILGTRQDQIEHLQFEIKYLAALEGAPSELTAIAAQLFMLNRLMLGLCEEIDEPRRKLIENLGTVLGCYNGRWRTPAPEGVLSLRHDMHIGIPKGRR